MKDLLLTGTRHVYILYFSCAYVIPTLASRDLNELGEEAKILLEIPSQEHILKIIGFCFRRRHYAIVLEYIDGGNLSQLLCPTKDPDPYLEKWSHRLDMARQIDDGMEYLHSLKPPVIHYNLKPSKILVKKSLTTYLCKVYEMYTINLLISVIFGVNRSLIMGCQRHELPSPRSASVTI